MSSTGQINWTPDGDSGTEYKGETATGDYRSRIERLEINGVCWEAYVVFGESDTEILNTYTNPGTDKPLTQLEARELCERTISSHQHAAESDDL